MRAQQGEVKVQGVWGHLNVHTQQGEVNVQGVQGRSLLERGPPCFQLGGVMSGSVRWCLFFLVMLVWP